MRIFTALAAVFALSLAAADAADQLSPNGRPLMPFAGDERLANTASGELFADIMGSTVTAQRMFRDTLPSVADYSQSAHMISNSYCGPEAKWVMWDTPFLARDTRKRNDGYLGYNQTVSGFATGVSRMLGDTTAIGVSIGYDARKLTGRDNYHWRNKADTLHTAVYGGTAIGCFFVDGYLGFSRSWQRTERDVYNGADSFRNHGNFNDTVLSAGLKASYVWILPNDIRVTPAIGLDYSHVKLSGFTEKPGVGSATALRVRNSSHNSLQMPITVAVNRTFSANFLTFGGVCSLWTPEVRAGYVPQFGAKRASLDYNFIDAAAPAGKFTASSNKLGGSYGTIGTGVKIKLKDKFIFAVDYDYTFGKKYDRHVVTGTYGVSF